MLEELTPLEITERRRFMLRHYVVTGDTMKRGGRHLRYSVICADIRRAVDLTEKAHPECVIHGVADHGSIDKVDS